MKKAGFMAPDWLVDRIGDGLIKRCKEKDINLDCHKFSVVAEKFSEIYHCYSNIITWGFKMPHEWYIADGKNVLFIENGLLRQSAGAYIDNLGFFINSSLVKKQEWSLPFTDEEWSSFMDHVDKHYRWEWASGGNKDGPIFIAIQQKHDAPCKYHFVHNEDQDPIEMLLDYCKTFLPDREAIVKPHPKFLDEWDEKKDVYLSYFRDNWSVVSASEQDPAPILPKCSALVTINSSLATEAQILNIPVATFGSGIFSRSQITLDCSRRHERLADILSFEPDMWRIASYLCAIFRHHISYDNFYNEVEHNHYFNEWAKKAKG